MREKRSYLVFGASGTIGMSCSNSLSVFGNVVEAGHEFNSIENQISSMNRFHGVIWAQGINLADSVGGLNFSDYEEVIAVNVTFILKTLKILLDKSKIEEGAQLVVLSSIWGGISRPNKLSYGVSKAALSGLIRSLAVDLGLKGIQVNSVSPGPIDTPMTRSNMNKAELDRAISESPLKRLVSLDEVTSVVCGLVTGKLSGITGQDIVVDGGWSVSKLV
jgi:NAD(P)-dependent dehydrogenase (short-subunit alcohol dehydrogenase family)